MSKNKYVITMLCNEKKPITYEQPLFKEKDDGMYMNFTESIITQMVKARDEDRFKAICERIQEFIEREGIDVCFAINQNELLDCLNEHQRLKLQIEQLEHRLANCIEPKFKVGQEVWHCYKNCNEPAKTVIESIDIEVNEMFIDFTYYDVDGFGFDEIMLFTTEKEAIKDLEELQNGSICD